MKVALADTVLAVLLTFAAPAFASDVRVDIKATAGRPMALRDDGFVLTWGVTPGRGWCPLSIAPLENVVAVGVGMAVDRSGHAWIWNGDRAQPMPALGEVIAATRGSRYGAAVRRDGTVWRWREEEDKKTRPAGALMPVSGVPPDQVKGPEDVVAIDASGKFALALTRDGSVWQWEENAQTEAGGWIAKFSPAVRIGGLPPVIAIAAGVDHTLAVGREGEVWAWGSNESGQLGDGTGMDRDTPVRVIHVSDVVSVAAGGNHSVALHRNGTVSTWGGNNWGQLGDGSLTDRALPMVLKGLDQVTAIHTRGIVNLALRRDGSVWGWGDNRSGQLGHAPDPRFRMSAVDATPVEIKGVRLLQESVHSKSAASQP